MTQRILQKKPKIHSRQYGDALFLVDAEVGVLHELNSVAGRIWELSDGETTELEIAQSLSKEFEVTPEKALHDLTLFVEDLLMRKVLFIEEQ